MHRATAAAGVLMGLSASMTASATEYLDEPFETPTPERRHGFSVGIAGGLSAVSVSGYPDDAAKIGLAEHESSTGLVLSNGGGVWIGGAITDFLTLGIGILGGDASGNGLKGGGGSFLVRIETFPLISLGGSLSDAGLAFSFGTGGLALERDGEKVVEAGGTSAIGVSAFHETLRFWHLAMGPQVDYEHQFADSVSAHRLVLGWRTVFYAGP